MHFTEIEIFLISVGVVKHETSNIHKPAAISVVNDISNVKDNCIFFIFFLLFFYYNNNSYYDIGLSKGTASFKITMNLRMNAYDGGWGLIGYSDSTFYITVDGDTITTSGSFPGFYRSGADASHKAGWTTIELLSISIEEL